MKAIAVTPKRPNSAYIIDLEEPKYRDDEVLVRVLNVGVCGTDREINQGLYGEAPTPKDHLVLGHESFGVVDEVGKSVKSLKKGDYVVRTVRRPCGECVNCFNGQQDMCLTGNFLETGIKGLDGSLVEYYVESPSYLVKVPASLKDVGVLLEPLSFVEKVARQAFTIQKRMYWEPKKALILGAGPIGILEAMILSIRGLDVCVVARSKSGNLKSKIVNNIGATYQSTSMSSLDDIAKKMGNIDIIVEATGDSSMSAEAMRYLGKNGILCLTSITGDNKEVTFPIAKFNFNTVLYNKLIVGVVNADIRDYEQGVKDLEEFENRWKSAVGRMITTRVTWKDYRRLFELEKDDIKVVFDV